MSKAPCVDSCVTLSNVYIGILHDFVTQNYKGVDAINIY